MVASEDQSWPPAVARLPARPAIACEREPTTSSACSWPGCAKNAAALAAGLALQRGANAAGAAAGRIYGECYALAETLDARDHETFAGLAGAGRPRRHGARPTQPQPPRRRDARPRSRIPRWSTSLGQASEALELVPLLARAMASDRVRAPAIDELAGWCNPGPGRSRRGSLRRHMSARGWPDGPRRRWVAGW